MFTLKDDETKGLVDQELGDQSAEVQATRLSRPLSLSSTRRSPMMTADMCDSALKAKQQASRLVRLVENTLNQPKEILFRGQNDDKEM